MAARLLDPSFFAGSEPPMVLARRLKNTDWDALSEHVHIPAHERVAAEHYDEITVSLDPETKTYRCSMRPLGRPSFTQGLLRDLLSAQASFKALFADAMPDDPPVRHCVLQSGIPGIFNLGGDLEFFAQKIRQRDREGLRSYAYDCIRIVHTTFLSLDLPVVMVALVQGDALGGGFEAALSCNVIVAERGAKFGLPEVLFNLFPGMGAYSLLSRRLGSAQAEKIILSGRLFSAEELHDMGLVQVLAEPGCGEEATREYIARNNRRFNAAEAVCRVGRRMNPLGFEELRDVTDVWVEAALRLQEHDLRKMERLAAAQDRRRSSDETSQRLPNG